jgi:Cu-Zn family superoxide dismutase
MKATSIACALLFIASPACKKDADKKQEQPQTEQKPATEEAKTPDKPAEPDKPAPAKATATLKAASDSKVSGTVTFEAKDGKVLVTAKVEGLTPGEHGFHVHETGDCSAPDAKSAGGHFNPESVEHGAPDSPAHHTGDLGNLVANESGVAEKSFEVDFLSLEEGAKNSVRGKAVIVHGGADDMKSQPSGNAGPRVACGVVE